MTGLAGCAGGRRRDLRADPARGRARRRRRGAVQPGQRSRPGAGAGSLPGRRRGRVRSGAAARRAVDHHRGADRHGRAGRDPARRRHAHRPPPVPRGRRAGGLAGRGRHARHRRQPGRSGASRLRPRLAAGPARRHGPGTDRSRGGVLGAGTAGGIRPSGHAAGGRVGSERPGRDRVDGSAAVGRPAAARVPSATACSSSRCRWWWVQRSASSAGWDCSPRCAGCRCRARASTRCGCWCWPWSSTAWRRWRTGPASSPCSSPAS